ncbi:MAG: hypothetical protein ABJD97_05640 [Betaproteobacteria bacterium]
MAPEEPLVTALLDRLASLDVKLIERREEVPFGDRHGLSRRLDASVHLRLPDGHAIELAIEVKRMAYPRDIRAAVETLRNYEHTR